MLSAGNACSPNLALRVVRSEEQSQSDQPKRCHNMFSKHLAMVVAEVYGSRLEGPQAASNDRLSLRS